MRHRYIHPNVICHRPFESMPAASDDGASKAAGIANANTTCTASDRMTVLNAMFFGWFLFRDTVCKVVDCLLYGL